MGWAHTMHLCQAVCEKIVRGPAAQPEALLLDCRAAPPLATGVHALYVDKFVAFALGALNRELDGARMRPRRNCGRPACPSMMIAWGRTCRTCSAGASRALA